MIRFNDGISFDTSGDYRVEHRKDGYYVVGHNSLIPVKDSEEGMDIIKSLMEVGKKHKQKRVEKENNNEPKWCNHCNTNTAYKELAHGGPFGAHIEYFCRTCGRKA